MNELVQLAGISGPGGELVDQLGGAVISTVVTNAVNSIANTGELSGNLFAGLGANVENAALGWAANELASLVVKPTTQDGSIGEAIGGAVLGYIFGPLGDFVGDVIGTLVGDLFGEPASPQAWVRVTGSTGTDDPFASTFLGSKQSGPVSEVISIGNTIATDLNEIVQATGGVVAASSSVQGFNFGVRQGVAEVDGFGTGIKFNDVQSAINYAIFKEIAGIQIAGGNVYDVRALESASASFSMTTLSSGLVEVNSSVTTVTGDLAVASDYQKYLADPAVVDGIIAAAPNSPIAEGWVATLASAASLGLGQRSPQDWEAGWEGFLQANGASAAQITFSFYGKERVINAGTTPVDDTIDSIDKTVIQGDSSNAQTIVVSDTNLLTPTTGTATANGTLVSGTLAIPIAAMIYGGSGTGDVIYAGDQGNDVFGGNGGTAAAPDIIYGYSSPTDKTADATWIFGGSGSNQITAGISSGDYLDGGSGNDTINATLTNSAWIDGGTGNNLLEGGTGDDVITAEGVSTLNDAATSTFYSDTMDGDGGVDTYIINPGTLDTINNAPTGTATVKSLGTGTLLLNGVTGFDQVDAQTVTGAGGSTTLEITVFGTSTLGTSNANGYDTVSRSSQVIEQIYAENYNIAANRLQYLQLSNGTELNISNFGTNFISGTAPNMFLEGNQNNDSIFGGSGTDTIEGFAGNDMIVGDGILSGGNGNNTILGGATNDVIWGGNGSNLIDGGGGVDFILGGAFDLKTSDIDTIHGGSTGGAGTDTVIGGPEGNLFEYAAGDGDQELVSSLSTIVNSTPSTVAGWDAVYNSTTGGFNPDFARDTVSGNITVTNLGATAMGVAAGTAIFNTATNTMSPGGVVDVVDSYAGIGNSTIPATQAESTIYWQPTLTTASNLKDTLQFAPGITPGELLFQKSGNDLLIGINDGNSSATGTAGTFGDLADQIDVKNYFTTGAIGALAFVSSTGSTTTLNLSNVGTVPGYALTGPTVSSGNGTVSATGTATAWITGGFGNDVLIGGSGNDILTAGPDGIDTLEGGAGSNTLIGTGQTFASYQDDTVGSVGVVANLNDNTSSSPTLAPNVARASSKVPSVADLGFYDAALTPAFWSRGAVENADMPRAIPMASHIVSNTSTVYTPTGYAAGDTYDDITGLIGSKYNDTLVASATLGSTLDGGGGSDLLVGGTGGDDFIYNTSTSVTYGSDTIQLGGGNDTLDIDNIGSSTGVTYDDLSFASANGTLVITDTMTGHSGQTITILGLGSTGETLTLNLDGDISSVLTGVPGAGSASAGSPGLAFTTSTSSTVHGGSSLAGALITGGPGNDDFIGMSGDDTFEAGNQVSASETSTALTPGAQTAQDTFTGGNLAANSTLASATDNTVSFAGAYNAVTVGLNAAGNSTLVGGGATGDVLTNIQNLVGSNGNDSLSIAATGEIDGGTGNDTIYGNGGNDTLIGDGVDSITSGIGNSLISVANDTVIGTGSTLFGGAGNDTIYGGSGNDSITDTIGYSSSLNGGAGNDTITGNGTSDTLQGGGGNDKILGHGDTELLQDANSNSVIADERLAGTTQPNAALGDTLYAGAGQNTVVGGITEDDVLISNGSDDGNGSTTGTIIAGKINFLFGASESYNPSTGFSTVAPASQYVAGDDTFEISAQSGVTQINATWGVNEIEFDSSVNYQNLEFIQDSTISTQLDIIDTLSGANCTVQVENFFNTTLTDPSERDFTDNGEVLFASSLANSSSSTWTENGAAGTGTLAWLSAASADDSISGPSNANNVLIGSQYFTNITSNDTVVGTGTVSSNGVITGRGDFLAAGSGGSNITANVANAYILGGSGSDTITGGGGVDTIVGGSGQESIVGGTGNDIITAGTGSDTIIGGSGANTINGGAGTDSITAGAGTTVINAGTGPETIVGGTAIGGAYLGNATINAGTGPDVITTTSGFTTIIGGTGGDTITTGTGYDSIQLGAGSAAGDSINAAAGVDTIDLRQTTAGSADTIVAGSDTIYEGLATDTISGNQFTEVDFASISGGVLVNAQTGASGGAATGDSITGVGTLFGTNGSDTLTASNAATAVVNGIGGNDILYAGTGTDTLENGPSGNDAMYGDTAAGGLDTFILNGGNNSITGGAGNDDYLISNVGNDTIHQAARSGTGQYQDDITLMPGASGSLIVYGPQGASTGATIGAQLGFVSSIGTTATSTTNTYASYYDLWFQASGSNLIISQFGTNGVQESVTLSNWFSNSSLQANPADQLFDVGLANSTNANATYSLFETMPTGGFTTNGLLVPSLVTLDASYAMPSNAAGALALYNTITANSYRTQLDLLWGLNAPPSLTLGTNSGSIAEQIPTSPGSSTLTFQVSVGDSLTLAQNLQLSASIVGTSTAGTVSVSGITPSNGNAYAGTANVTLTLNQGQDFETGSLPIAVSVMDTDGAVTTQTFTATVAQQDPPPSFPLAPPASITMFEGASASTYGSSSTYSFSVYDLTPTGTVDTGAVTVTASSSNTSLISSSDIILTAGSLSTSGSTSGSQSYTVGFLSNPGAFGSSNITLTASDGTLTTNAYTTVIVTEEAEPPVLTVPATESFNESASNQTLTIPISVTSPNGVAPTVTLSDPQNPSGWGTPTLIPGANGQDTIQLAINNYTYGSGNIVVSATSNYGSAVGTASTTQTIAVTADYEHLNFGVTAPGPISLAENSGVGVLTGIGTLTISNGNNDTYSYSILSGDPVASNGTPVFGISNAGVVLVDEPIAYNGSGSNSYTMAVQVSNPGGYTHDANVIVNVTDNSPPVVSISTKTTLVSIGSGKTYNEIYELLVTAVDPHGLSSTFTLTSQLDKWGPVYAISSSSGGGTSTATISVPLGNNNDNYYDSVTVEATNSQGLSSSSSLSFEPGIPNSARGLPPAITGQVRTPTGNTTDSTAQLIAAIASFGASGTGALLDQYVPPHAAANEHVTMLAAAHH